jgi:hypothetical protein
MTDRFVSVLPSAGRLMQSLRDVGYDLPSAVADLIDNSIDANAGHIDVMFNPAGSSSWVRVTDDGIGMTPHGLDEAMRYGSDAAYTERALGHFGLGLKTASLSQCRRLTVASRSRASGRVTIRRWDLDAVIRRDCWALERIRLREAPPHLRDALPREGGTVVLWEQLDRMLPRRPTAGMTARVMKTAVEEVRGHLAMVFHRFLTGEAFDGRRRLEVVVDGERLSPWDPFARSEPHTRALPAQTLCCAADDASIAITVAPFILPAQQHFSSADAHRRSAGPNRWNRHQGFYVYRRDRLLQAGGWNRLRTLDEHAKLARIAVDLPVGDEHRFSVDVAKMRVSFPEEVRPQLRAVAAGAVAAAQERYRDHLAARLEHDDGPHDMSPEAIRISRDWPAIMRAVDDVVGHDLRLRDRLLLRLANADPDEHPDERLESPSTA